MHFQKSIFTILFIGIQVVCSGQTTKYWSLNFASEPTLLGGAVIGTGAGNQSAYYNPALISEMGSDNLSISADVVTLDFYNIENAYGEDLDHKFAQFNILPTFISFLIQSKRNKRLSFEVAALSRDRTDYDVFASTAGEFDVYPTISG